MEYYHILLVIYICISFFMSGALSSAILIEDLGEWRDRGRPELSQLYLWISFVAIGLLVLWPVFLIAMLGAPERPWTKFCGAIILLVFDLE